ncbi:MAG: helix-turn-helix domain containing protein [Gemmatimonadetes bacterium]|nr:helix-turn-helix domain containing protein [Gemmatimonadota bacterium]
MAPPTREQILAAAAKLYAEHGFRGTTTRAIAETAGVNEVTLFRIFGSKETLIVEAMRAHSVPVHVGTLPEVPVDPQAELAAWALQMRKVLVSMRSMIRQAMSDAEQNPEMQRCTQRGADATVGSLRRYLDCVRDEGFIAEGAETHAAGAMLLGALYHDAMSREFMPHLFIPAATAPAIYARLCLQSLGYNAAAHAPQRLVS